MKVVLFLIHCLTTQSKARRSPQQPQPQPASPRALSPTKNEPSNTWALTGGDDVDDVKPVSPRLCHVHASVSDIVFRAGNYAPTGSISELQQRLAHYRSKVCPCAPLSVLMSRYPHSGLRLPNHNITQASQTVFIVRKRKRSSNIWWSRPRSMLTCLERLCLWSSLQMTHTDSYNRKSNEGWCKYHRSQLRLRFLIVLSLWLTLQAVTPTPAPTHKQQEMPRADDEPPRAMVRLVVPKTPSKFVHIPTYICDTSGIVASNRKGWFHSVWTHCCQATLCAR